MIRARQVMAEHMAKAGTGKWAHDDTLPVPTTKQSADVPTADEIKRVMSALGRKGGTVSGAKRMENLSEAKRKAIARKGGLARAAKAKKNRPAQS